VLSVLQRRGRWSHEMRRVVATRSGGTA